MSFPAKLQTDATDIPSINNRLHDSFIFVLESSWQCFVHFVFNWGRFVHNPPSPSCCLLPLPFETCLLYLGITNTTNIHIILLNGSLDRQLFVSNPKNICGGRHRRHDSISRLHCDQSHSSVICRLLWQVPTRDRFFFWIFQFCWNVKCKWTAAGRVKVMAVSEMMSDLHVGSFGFLPANDMLLVPSPKTSLVWDPLVNIQHWGVALIWGDNDKVCNVRHKRLKSKFVLQS